MESLRVNSDLIKHNLSAIHYNKDSSANMDDSRKYNFGKMRLSKSDKNNIIL